MTDCKHDWHFVEGAERLRCARCQAETGPRTSDQRVQDLLERPAVTQSEVLAMLHNVVAENQQYTTWTVSTPHLVMLAEKIRQAELDACCDLLEGMHACRTGNHNYYLYAAKELRKLRSKNETR